MIQKRTIAVLAATLLLWAATSLASPPRSEAAWGPQTDTLPTCLACTVQFSDRDVLGDPSDAFLLRSLPRVAALSDGRVLAFVPNASRHEVLLYARDGSVRRVGSLGEGPGEYSLVDGIGIGANDSIFVVHDARRVAVFDSSLEFVRSLTAPLPISDGIVPRRDGSLLLVGGMTREDQRDPPLHLVESDGSVAASFGPDGLMRATGLHERQVAPDGAAIWIAERGNYRLQKVSASGDVIRTLAIEPPASWGTTLITSVAQRDSLLRSRPRINLNEALRQQPSTLPVPPFARMSGVSVDREGLLWLSWNVPRHDWSEVEVEFSPRDYLSFYQTIVSYDILPRLYRTVIDVIDPEEGVLLARSEVDGLGQIAGQGIFVRTLVDDLGVVRLEASSVELLGR